MKRLWLVVIGVLVGIATFSQNPTKASGVVYDAETGETLPFAQVFFMTSSKKDAKPTTVGTTSDMDGAFSISTTTDYTCLRVLMMGYKPEDITLRKGQTRSGLKVKLEPESYALQDIVVVPKAEKKKYKRKGNPAVELIRNVIAHKDSSSERSADQYTANLYRRMSFSMENFNPNFEKGIWKSVQFVKDYIDTTGTYPSITLSIRENLSHDFYQKSPRKEKNLIYRSRFFGLESVIGSSSFNENVKGVFNDININDDNMNVLYNRFVSPLSSSLAVSYYQYYIQDTILMDGDSCIDLAFVPVNSQSYSFTGHLYILKDSTYKVKKYVMKTPKDINLNFVSDYQIEHNNKRLDNGLWVSDRTTTSAKFYLFSKKKNIVARQTSIYTDYDFDSPIDPSVYSIAQEVDTTTMHDADSISVREDFQYWDEHRPEPLSFYESSVMDLVQQFKTTPKFSALIQFVNAVTTEYVNTVPPTRWGESKWDFGPIYSTISWNMLEGVRLRIGGSTTANLHPNWFFMGYTAFGTSDLRPKYNATIMYSFNKKRYHQYEPLRHHILVSATYDVEEPMQQQGDVIRDNIINSIPTSKPVMKNYLYVFRAQAQYMKEWPFHLYLRTDFKFEDVEPAGAMSFKRITGPAVVDAENPDYRSFTSTSINRFFNYEGDVELRWTPGSQTPISRYGMETQFSMDHDSPVLSLKHKVGYLDDRPSGGKGFIYNYTELVASKRFWFSSFGHLDAQIQGGYVWGKAPFYHLYSPTSTTSILLARNAFNLMQPMEFMMDKYVSVFMTYYFKGWILNRIPGINKLRLRGVVSFSGIYGGLSSYNNPYIDGNEGLYEFPNAPVYDANGVYQEGYTSSPIGALPYMEITAGFENIFRFFRIDYVRRITYNDYVLPDGHHRVIGGWGRNGVKLSFRLAL